MRGDIACDMRCYRAFPECDPSFFVVLETQRPSWQISSVGTPFVNLIDAPPTRNECPDKPWNPPSSHALLTTELTLFLVRWVRLPSVWNPNSDVSFPFASFSLHFTAWIGHKLLSRLLSWMCCTVPGAHVFAFLSVSVITSPLSV
jgi:hypothetical protein